MYQRLASYELLERCSKCLTQNANECLNGMIWAKCPKVKNPSKLKVEAATAEAVGEYNFGSSAQQTVMRTSGFGQTYASKKIMTRRDSRRVRLAKMKNTNKFKAYRMKCRMLQAYRKQKLNEKEGLTYGPGEF